jgi:glucose-1-phosphate thymidylyltransferase
MEIAKALILAGRGSNDGAWPSWRREPQHLFPVANKPILVHNVEALRAAGVLEAAVFVDPDSAEPVERAIGDGRDLGVSISYIAWDDRDGVAGALAEGRGFLAGEPAFIQQAGALLGERLHTHISAFAREGLDALALRLTRPAPEPVPVVAMPWYLLSPQAIEMLGDGDAPAPNPVAGVQAGGGRVRVQMVDGWAPCQGDVDALLEGNRRTLEGLQTSFDPASVEESNIQGSVEIHPTAKVRRSLVRGPAIIGPGADVSDAYIGPYTSIGAGVVIEYTEIEYSIVLAEAELRFVGTRLASSVIGRRARVVRGFDLPRAVRMTIGEGAEVELG